MLKIADDEVMQNAKIIDTFLGIEKEPGIFTWRLTFKTNGGCIGYGDWILGTTDKMTAKPQMGESILWLLDTIGADSWENLKGQYCRLLIGSEGGKGEGPVKAIYNLMDDSKMFTIKYFASYRVKV